MVEDTEECISAEKALDQVTRAIGALDMPFGIYDETGRLLVCSRKTEDLIRDRLLDEGSSLLNTPVHYSDVAQAFYQSTMPPDEVEERLQAALENFEDKSTYFFNVETDGKWNRRVLTRAETGQTLAFVMPIDELIKETRALHEAKEELEHLAFHDPLTGLLNRRGLSEHLAKLAKTPEKDAKNVAVLHVDLDKFKLVNDTLGHDAGDTVLSEAAKVLQREVRNSDLVTRVGGDEFVIVCHDVTNEGPIANVAARIVENMAHPIKYGEELCQIGASIGISITSAHNISEHVLMDADIALYEAKKKGRGRYEFFLPVFRDRYSLIQRRMNQVREAIVLNAFEPFFQPQICARTGNLVGMEVLARWRDREAGVRLPEAFLPAIEEARLMDPLDDMILRKTLSTLRSWRAEGIEFPHMTVNLSKSRLMDPNLVSQIKWAIDEHDLSVDMIGVEVLESVVVGADGHTIIKNINKLSDAGFKVALDDFGTGNASITSLRDMHLDTVKIDQSFVENIDKDAELRTITGAMIGLIKNLGMRAVCECVEHSSEADILRELGADAFQGYVFGKPMEAGFVPIWLDAYEDDRREGFIAA